MKTYLQLELYHFEKVRTDRTFERDENVSGAKISARRLSGCELTGLLNGMKTHWVKDLSVVIFRCELTGLLNGMKTRFALPEADLISWCELTGLLNGMKT